MPPKPSVTFYPFTIVADNNEGYPYTFASLPTRAADGNKRMAVKVVSRSLETGDYSIEGMESRVTVERKSLTDLYGTLGGGRERFEREFERMQAMEFAAVVVEAGLPEICRPDHPRDNEQRALEVLRTVAAETGSLEAQRAVADLDAIMERRWAGVFLGVEWMSQLNPKSVWGTIFSWQQRYRVHWCFAGSRRLGELATFEMLERFWRESNG